MSVSNMDSAQETVYRSVEESHVVMSDKVQSLAGSVYQEFEKMIGKYDHDVVKDLMPLVVNVLECLDTAYTENQEHEVELELVREDNEQLVTQYEREKHLRKTAEQKLMEVEDCIDEERKDMVTKIESLESLVRMLELKAKNSSDHVFRLEEKENDMKKEYTKLHERYTDLLKTHMDNIERTKMMLSTSERLEPAASRPPRMPSIGLGLMNRSSGPVSFGFQSLEEVRPDDRSLLSDDMGEMHASSHDSTASNVSLKNELTEGDDAGEDQKGASNRSSKVQSPEEEMAPVMGRSTTNKEQRSANTLYQELSFQETMDPDDVGDVTGSWVHPGEYASSANDNFFGMGKEVENLIMENNELLATKNALNIVKDDLILKVDELTSEQEVLREELSQLRHVKDRLKTKISELEEEIKKVREELAKSSKGNKSDDEDEDVPMAQRKRFTRVEMARVLMERNQYKERLLELQEAVRWKEAIRAQRIDVGMDSGKGRGVWGLFSGLFRSKAEGPPPRKAIGVGVHFTPNQVTPLPPSSGSGPSSASDRKRPVDYLDRGPVFSEKKNVRRALERREQYRQVRAHVRKEDGRLQAYGWSLPAQRLPTPADPGRVPVPVPVFCQPLANADPSTKYGQLQVWCAAGVNLSGGRTRDGGSIVGSSVFYEDSNDTSQSADPTKEDAEPHITRLEEELKEGERVREDGEKLEQRLSSAVWIVSSMHSESRVSVVDAADPQRSVDTFSVCQSHVLCIASVPGAVETDYQVENSEPEITENSFKAETEEGETPLGAVRLVQIEPSTTEEQKDSGELLASTILPTMWLGAQSGYLYVHSSVSDKSKCLASVKMPDSVLSITHCAGRVLVALANGTVAVFRRDNNAQWNLNQYHTVDLGDSQSSVRCMSLVHSTVWCGYRNKIHVLDPANLSIKASVEAHPRKESQVRQLAWLGDGVWVSIRLDSTLRLYHAHTFEHLQDVDIEPYVSKMLGTGKLGFSFVRITALLVSTGRLWIGTGEGVVISVPLSEEAGCQGTVPGSAVRVYKDAVTDKLTPGSFVPYCSMSEAQLSFHGHRDVVKFFIAVPGKKSSNSVPHMLVMSGGEGYVDFRNGDGMDDDAGTIPEEPEGTTEGLAEDYELVRNRRVDMSHLIIWQVALPILNFSTC